MTITRRNLLGATAALAASRALPGCAPSVATSVGDAELVVGPGGWCWFQSPRVAVDASGLVWLGSTQGSGAPVPGSVDVTGVDLERRRVVARRSLARDRVDDHTSPSVLAVGDGVQVGWAAHRRLDWVEVGPLDGTRQRIVRPGALRAPGRGTAYVSAHVVAGQRWVLYRGESFSWNLLTSDDGTRWTPHGLVLRPGEPGRRPYLLAAAGPSGLHLLATDGNPTEVPGCGAWAGIVRPDLTITTTAGRRVGRVGDQAPVPGRLSPVASGRAAWDEAFDRDAWICDLRVHHGRPTALLSIREPWPLHAHAVGRWRHRFLWARPDRDGRWRAHHLAWAGSELYGNQPDYSGLASLDPADPHQVVVSTDVDPETGAPLVSDADGQVHRELFAGALEGARWSWRPLTEHGIEDNLRPVLVATPHGRLLAWMRGTYRSWTRFDTSIVLRLA